VTPLEETVGSPPDTILEAVASSELLAATSRIGYPRSRPLPAKAVV